MRPVSDANRTVLITGASSGLGEACARAFASHGSRVVLAARREDRLNELTALLQSQGHRALAVRCDVTQPDDARALFDRLGETFGALDVLVNNAGVGLFGPLEAVTDAQLERVFQVNVLGLTRVTQGALPFLKKSADAHVVNVSSVLGHRALPMLGGYSASKAAVNSLTESMRLELAPWGIDVHLVSPGLIATEFRQVRLHAPGFGPEQLPDDGVPPEAVAQTIVEMCRTGRKEAVVGWSSRAIVWSNRLAPRLFDKIAHRMVGPSAKPPKTPNA